MSTSRPTEPQSGVISLTSTLPIGDEGNATFSLSNATAAVFECTAASSGTGTIEVQSHIDGEWYAWECYEYASGAGTFTYRSAGTTITLADNDLLFVAAPGMYAVRFNLAGTSVSGYWRTTERMTDVLLQRLIQSGITVDITEFPAAAAITDNFANPTTTSVMAMLMGWDGSNWDRLPGTSTTGLTVNLAAGTSLAGLVSALPSLRLVQITPTMDTSALSANDVWFDSTQVANATRANDAPSYLVGLIIIDQDDQAAADIDLFVLKANVSLGTINNAPSISDANALHIVRRITAASADWKDLGGVKVNAIDLSKLPVPVFPASGTRDIYLAATNAGTPTNTASGVKVTLIFQDGALGA